MNLGFYCHICNFAMPRTNVVMRQKFLVLETYLLRSEYKTNCKLLHPLFFCDKQPGQIHPLVLQWRNVSFSRMRTSCGSGNKYLSRYSCELWLCCLQWEKGRNGESFLFFWVGRHQGAVWSGICVGCDDVSRSIFVFSCSKYRTVLFCHDFLSLDEGLFIVSEALYSWEVVDTRIWVKNKIVCPYMQQSQPANE